jgi:hypothetical protein
MRMGATGSRRLCSAANNPLRGQPRLEFLEGTLERAQARILDVIDEQLVVAARLVETDSPARDDTLPIARLEAREHVALSEHRAAQLRIAILQREIPMTRARPRHVG